MVKITVMSYCVAQCTAHMFFSWNHCSNFFVFVETTAQIILLKPHMHVRILVTKAYRNNKTVQGTEEALRGN